MPRFFVPQDLLQGIDLVLPADESRHISAVLRLRKGDEITIFNGHGKEAFARIMQSRPERVMLRIGAVSSSVATSGIELTLAQAVPKARGMDEIIRQATELGLARFVPLAAERVTARWSKDEAAGRVARWRRIAISAAKQCGLNQLPEIEPPCAPLAFAERVGAFDAAFIASLMPEARLFREALAELRAQRPCRILLMIGPEGDFSRTESEAACAAGAIPVSFGNLVLRVATAAIYGLSILRHEFGP